MKKIGFKMSDEREQNKDEQQQLDQEIGELYENFLKAFYGASPDWLVAYDKSILWATMFGTQHKKHEA